MKKQILFLLVSAITLLALISCGGDPYENSMYSEQPEIVTYQDYLAANTSLPEAGIETILAQGSEKGSIEKAGLLFKDSDGDGKLDDYEDWRLPAAERAADLISQMSIEEKLGLLNWTGSNGRDEMLKDDKGTEDAADDELLYGIGGLSADGSVEEGSFGERVVSHFIRFGNEGPTLEPLQEVYYGNNLQGLSERLNWGVPYLVSTDPMHDGWNGNETPVTGLSRWPFYMGLGALDDFAVTQQFGQTVAAETRMLARHVLLGPQVDIASEPRWARIQATFHADPNVVATQAEVVIKAMQGGDDLTPQGIATVAKHFPGTGSIEEGMDSHTFAGRYSVYPGGNIDAHRIPFEAAFKAGTTGVMSMYSILDNPEYQDTENGQPVAEGTAFNKTVMTDLLRGEMGFEGFTITDWSVIGNAAWGHKDIANTDDLIAEQFNAGTYMYGGDDLYALWSEAFENGLISEEDIDVALSRILLLPFKLGMFENPYVDIAEAEEFWNPDGEAMQARIDAGLKAMSRATVLVENSEVAHAVDLVPVNGTDESYINSVDRNGNGVVDVYFDSSFPNADSGQADTYAYSDSDQYLNINFVDNFDDADIAVVRFNARGGTYFGTQGGTPLTFDDPVLVWDHEAQAYTDEEVYQITPEDNIFAEFGRWTFSDWSQLTGGTMFNGYNSYRGGLDSKAAIEQAIAAKAANPGLKLIMGMTASRPGIVTEYVDSFDAFYIDFAATDKAFLDLVFWQQGIEPEGTLPVEFPRDMASVLAQDEDVPGDTENPLYEIGYGLSYAATGGYGN